MKSCIVFRAFAGIAGVVMPVFGQATTMEMVADGVWDGDNRMTLSIFVDSDLMQGSNTATHITDVRFLLDPIGANSTVEQISLLEGPGWDGPVFVNLTDEGYDGSGGHAGLEIEQAYFLPFIQPSEQSALGNGSVLIASFEILLSEPIDEHTELGWNFGQYGIEESVYPQDIWVPVVLVDVNANPDALPGHVFYLGEQEVDLGSFYIPAPSGLALLGLGGLFAGRRRRYMLERSL
jgi:hypothetical protein